MPGMDNAHALVVGIANYRDINPLPPTVLRDARDIYDTLVNPNYCGYKASNVCLLLDDKATGKALRHALADLARRSDADSNVFFYLSSHGGQVESGSYAGEYILPVDVDYTSDETIARTAISGAEFTETLRAIKARKVVVLFDCCHSGGIGQPKDATAPAMVAGLPDRYYDQLKGGRGRVIIASSRGSEYSWVLPGAENSVFTQHLLAGLRGGIASDDGMIRIFDLFEYLQPKVTVDRPDQHPIFKAEIEENFAVGLYLGGQKGVVPRDSHDQGFRYDVYISYAEHSRRDADWVWDALLPYLESVGLSVAISSDVREPGVSRVVSVERGLKQARRTLLVLSPDYLADEWGQFESVMMQATSIQENRARIVPLISRPIDETKTPARLSANMVGRINVVDDRIGRAPSDLSGLSGNARMDLRKLVRTLQSPLIRMIDTIEQPRPEYDYDAFVSHSIQDEEWVCNTLLPQLLSYDLRVLLLEDVAYPGQDRVMTAEEGLAKATRTIVVVSPTYMTEDWPELKDQMEHIPGFRSSTRLVPVQVAHVEESQLAEFGDLRVIDMAHSDPRRAKRSAGRLIWQLQQPLEDG